MRLARLADEGGFTLVEQLVACVVGIVVIFAAGTALDITPVLTARVQDRVDSAARARIAMDRIARELRSEVCMGPSSPAIVSAQDNSVTFYAYSGSGAYAPQLHTIAWSPATNAITDSVYVGTGTPPSMVFPSSPTRVDTVLADVVPEPGKPIFGYYAFSSSAPVAPTVALATPVSTTDASSMARIAIKFTTLAPGRPVTPQATQIENDVYVRTWNPDGANGPSQPPCV
jgi:hypothetical protein